MKFLLKAALVAVALMATIPVQASIDSGGYRDAITAQDLDLFITSAARDHIVQTGIFTILDQASSAPVVDRDGDQIGYRLDDIEPGSIFETIGIMDRDIVTHIDDVRLVDPKMAIDMLRYVKGEDDFTFTVRRQGHVLKFRVRVK